MAQQPQLTAERLCQLIGQKEAAIALLQDRQTLLEARMKELQAEIDKLKADRDGQSVGSEASLTGPSDTRT